MKLGAHMMRWPLLVMVAAFLIPGAELKYLETATENKSNPNSFGNDTKATLKGDVRYEYYQEIAKCCPEDLHMDDSYKCVKNRNVGQHMFAEELLKIGGKAKEKYVIVHDNEWEKCPIRQRGEFEVLHIPHDRNNTVYVFVDVEINYEEEINFDGFREMKYSCLEVSKDLHSMTALVCGDEEGADDKIN